MKKNHLVVSFLALSIMVLYSCKKEACRDCHYEKNGSEVEIGNYCGEELETIENSGYEDGGTVYDVHCEDHH